MGLLYVASALEAKHQVSIIDALAEGWKNVHKIEVNGEDKWYGGLEFEEIAIRIKRDGIKLVGITVPFSISHWSAQRVASAIKSINKNIITVLGGHHVTVRPLEVLSNKDVDYIVVGEGEYTMLELADALEQGNSAGLGRVEGIGYKIDSKPVINPARKPIQDLDSLSFPARHLLNLENYFSAVEAGQSPRGDYIPAGKKWATVITSRGCPYECVFCAIHLTMGRKWRPRSAQNVVKEIEEIVNIYGVRHLSIEDDNMTLDVARAKEICDQIIQKKLDITWCMPNGVRADALDEELIKKMKASGCTEVFVAPESGDQNVVNNIIKKRIDLKKIEEAVRLLSKNGVNVNAVFVIGCIGETKENIRKSIAFARKLIQLGAKSVCANIATPYYGTELYCQAKEKGFLLDILNDEHLSTAQPLINTPELTPKELLEYKNQFYIANSASGIIRIILSAVFSNPKLLIRSMLSLRTWRFLASEIRSRFFGFKKSGLSTRRRVLQLTPGIKNSGISLENIKCPVCKSQEDKLIFQAKDLRSKTSGEIFNIVRCLNGGFILRFFLFLEELTFNEHGYTFLMIQDYSWFSLLQSFKKFVNKESVVLEIGASIIPRTRELAKYCRKLIGVELFLERMPSNFKNISYLNGDWQKLSGYIEPESINVAICSHVIEHVPDDLLALNELYRVLKPGGVAVLNTPNRKRLIRFAIELFTGNRKFPWWEHLREYTENDLKLLIERSAFKKYDIIPVTFGIHAWPLLLYTKKCPEAFRKIANFWEVHLFKSR